MAEEPFKGQRDVYRLVSRQFDISKLKSYKKYDDMLEQHAKGFGE